jgi:hypothetical protein
MDNEKVQTLTSAIIIALIVERSPDFGQKVSQSSNLFLSRIKGMLKVPANTLFPGNLPDENNPEKWFSEWRNQVESIVVESDLEHDSAAVTLAQSLIESWEKSLSTPSLGFSAGYFSLLAGDPSTDAPPPEDKKK